MRVGITDSFDVVTPSKTPLIVGVEIETGLYGQPVPDLQEQNRSVLLLEAGSGSESEMRSV